MADVTEVYLVERENTSYGGPFYEPVLSWFVEATAEEAKQIEDYLIAQKFQDVYVDVYRTPEPMSFSEWWSQEVDDEEDDGAADHAGE